MKTNTSANEQATPAAVSATKPAHTPSAGAMRAAKALFKDPKFFTSDAKTLAERKAHYWAGKAQIIDRETGHAELVAALKKAHAWIAHYKTCAVALPIAPVDAAVTAALAKAQA